MRDIALRNGTLDRNTVSGWNSRADISVQRSISAMASSTTNRIRGRTLRDESLETNTARDLEQVVRMFVEMDVGPEFNSRMYVFTVSLPRYFDKQHKISFQSLLFYGILCLLNSSF